jgi:hypothetical protein
VINHDNDFPAHTPELAALSYSLSKTTLKPTLPILCLYPQNKIWLEKNNHASYLYIWEFQFIYYYLFLFLVGLGLNLDLHTYKAGTLPLEPQL